MASQNHPKKVLVLGAGIIGLSSAVRIQTQCPGVPVTIMADQFSPHTTSNGAAGLWEVIAVSKQDEVRLSQYADETYDHLYQLALSPLGSVTGTFEVHTWQMWDQPLEEELVYKDTVAGYRKMTQQELSRCPGAKDGRFFTTLIAEATPYMKWLTERFIKNGGQLIKQRINSLNEISSEWDVVVNCTGIGSYHLMQDHKLQPIRGQVFRVHAPWIKQTVIFEQPNSNTFSYVIPNTDTVVVGGTLQRDNWDESVSEKDAKDIWDRAVTMLPSLKNAKILSSWAGLRPFRETMRLEPETVTLTGQPDRSIKMVHNYGHGGGGITLHWGCARVAAQLVEKYLQQQSPSSIHSPSNSKYSKPTSKL